MPLDPYLSAKLPLLQELDFAALADPNLMARFLEFYADDFDWELPDGVDVDDAEGENGDAPVGLRIYRPRGETRAGLLWLHGGGFQGGNLDMPEAHVVSAELADRASAVVVSVDYRLAVGGIHYPAPVDDAVAGWRVLTALAGDGIPLGIGGASAGAAIAVSAALRVRAETGRAADAVLLIYPFLHFPTPAVSASLADEMRPLPGLTRFTPESIEQMVVGYVGRIADIPAEAMPGAARLGDLPPTTIVLSEYDDLRPSGELLARQLGESGVPTRTYLASGMLHGHLNRLPGLSEVDRSLDALAEALRTAVPAAD